MASAPFRLILIGLVAALAGCGGGGSSDEDQIRGVVDQWTAAVGAGNGKEACSYMVPTLGSLCPQFVRRNVANPQAFFTAEVERIVVNGDEATVGFDNGRTVEFKHIVQDPDVGYCVDGKPTSDEAPDDACEGKWYVVNY